MTTTPDITPELLRTVGSWLVEQPGSTDMALVEITEQADRLERERADQHRIDDLFQVFDTARRKYWTLPDPDDRPTYIAAAEIESYRAGILAVCAHLEQERSEHYAAAKAMLAHQDRSADADSDSCTKPEIPQVTPCARETRRWHDLHDVPADVGHVTDVDGHILVRPARGWSAYVSNPDFAPWTEVIADA